MVTSQIIRKNLIYKVYALRDAQKCLYFIDKRKFHYQYKVCFLYATVLSVCGLRLSLFRETRQGTYMRLVGEWK